jgi:putative transposase
VVDRLHASTALVVTNALGMALEQRRPRGETIIHSDQGPHHLLGVHSSGRGFLTPAIDGLGGRLLRLR